VHRSNAPAVEQGGDLFPHGVVEILPGLELKKVKGEVGRNKSAHPRSFGSVDQILMSGDEDVRIVAQSTHDDINALDRRGQAGGSHHVAFRNFDTASPERRGRIWFAGPHQRTEAEFGSSEDRFHNRAAEHPGSAHEEQSAFVGNSHSKPLKETFWLAGTVTLATPAKDLSAAELVIGLRSSCVAQLTSPVSPSVTRTAPPVLGPDSNCGSGFVRDRSTV